MTNHLAKIANAAPFGVRYVQLPLPIGPVDFAGGLGYGLTVQRRSRYGWETAKRTRRRAVAERVMLNMLVDGDMVRIRG